MQCVGTLAKSLGWRWQAHAERLIKPMKLTGLSDNLVQAFKVSYIHTAILLLTHHLSSCQVYVLLGYWQIDFAERTSDEAQGSIKHFWLQFIHAKG